MTLNEQPEEDEGSVGVAILSLYHGRQMLTLAEAFHWTQIGFCIAIGFGIAAAIAWVLFVLIFER